MTVGERIKLRRLELHLSQDELAKRVGYKSRSSINKIELARDLPLRKVELMARALETTPGYLMGWEELDLSHWNASQNMGAKDMFTSAANLSAMDTVDYKLNDPSAIIETSGDRKEALANKLYESYLKASPEIQQAVDLLLKADKHD